MIAAGRGGRVRPMRVPLFGLQRLRPRTLHRRQPHRPCLRRQRRPRALRGRGSFAGTSVAGGGGGRGHLQRWPRRSCRAGAGTAISSEPAFGVSTRTAGGIATIGGAAAASSAGRRAATRRRRRPASPGCSGRPSPRRPAWLARVLLARRRRAAPVPSPPSSAGVPLPPPSHSAAPQASASASYEPGDAPPSPPQPAPPAGQPGRPIRAGPGTSLAGSSLSSSAPLPATNGAAGGATGATVRGIWGGLVPCAGPGGGTAQLDRRQLGRGAAPYSAATAAAAAAAAASRRAAANRSRDDGPAVRLDLHRLFEQSAAIYRRADIASGGDVRHWLRWTARRESPRARRHRLRRRRRPRRRGRGGGDTARGRGRRPVAASSVAEGRPAGGGLRRQACRHGLPRCRRRPAPPPALPPPRRRGGRHWGRQRRAISAAAHGAARAALPHCRHRRRLRRRRRRRRRHHQQRRHCRRRRLEPRSPSVPALVAGGAGAIGMGAGVGNGNGNGNGNGSGKGKGKATATATAIARHGESHGNELVPGQRLGAGATTSGLVIVPQRARARARDTCRAGAFEPRAPAAHEAVLAKFRRMQVPAPEAKAPDDLYRQLSGPLCSAERAGRTRRRGSAARRRATASRWRPHRAHLARVACVARRGGAAAQCWGGGRGGIAVRLQLGFNGLRGRRCSSRWATSRRCGVGAFREPHRRHVPESRRLRRYPSTARWQGAIPAS